MSAQLTEQLLFTRAQAAAKLAKSERQLDIHIAHGDIAAVRDGSRIKITAEALQRFIDRLPAHEPGGAS